MYYNEAQDVPRLYKRPVTIWFAGGGHISCHVETLLRYENSAAERSFAEQNNLSAAEFSLNRSVIMELCLEHISQGINSLYGFLKKDAE